MAKGDKSSRYLVWLEQAKYDLLAAKSSTEAGYFEWACFQSQQSLEKSVKAILVHAGMRAPRIHKLGILMGMSNQVNPAFAQIEIQYRRIESYTFLARYPFLLPGQSKSPHEFITSADATECIAIAEKALVKIGELLESPVLTQAPRDMAVTFFNPTKVDERVAEFVTKVTSLMQVEKIVLYGSFARNKAQPVFKTMDMLIIADTDLSFVERIKIIRDLVRGGSPIIEPLIYTPHEFQQLIDEEGEGYLEVALEEGKVVYPAKP